MIETAISAGLTAPMSRPIGAWIRASAVLVEPERPHSFEPLGVSLPRSERADVEAVRLQRDDQRRVVDLGIVGQEADRGVAVRGEAASASSGHSATTGVSGKRSGVAKAVRGSMTVTSSPAILAIGASAWRDVDRADQRQTRGAGAWTVRK